MQYPSIPCHLVVDKIKQAMEAERLMPPGDLMADITMAFKTLNIHRDGRRGEKRSYIKVKEKKEKK